MSTQTRAHRGDQRRAALLGSLDEILRERAGLDDSSLDSINIAEISRRAGVTRSAFYFYFENKQAAVAALMEEMYEAIATGNRLRTDGTPTGRITATIVGLFDAWEAHRHLFRAMLDARATSAAVRELWDSDRLSFVAPVAAMISAERASGRAPNGADATAVASVLLELNDRMLERLAHGGDRAAIQEAVIEIWLRTIYGRTER
ncbi:TetR/AcrR family transcriptional regulator [Nocardioides sp. cx-173]|uniref:TetR/AcrR family transcriptional regulator n=1 Tax=Nocardioides sp. cx-173 TaxID=2898796 RepID=UPI001E36C786|nr:TetR/AcrR family transcriptional regulator [Nocardioides sp. cx-173]MCD4525902.1 TetR/AcrR family transcriptional regulator [Nocardioides sp. cx-173]UGB40053.1 TetR/AcrR family transcriptional regulator [Nocardioides sp. cx-173]